MIYMTLNEQTIKVTSKKSKIYKEKVAHKQNPKERVYNI